MLLAIFNTGSNFLVKFHMNINLRKYLQSTYERSSRGFIFSFSTAYFYKFVGKMRNLTEYV